MGLVEAHVDPREVAAPGRAERRSRELHDLALGRGRERRGTVVVTPTLPAIIPILGLDLARVSHPAAREETLGCDLVHGEHIKAARAREATPRAPREARRWRRQVADEPDGELAPADEPLDERGLRVGAEHARDLDAERRLVAHEAAACDADAGAFA